MNLSLDHIDPAPENVRRLSASRDDDESLQRSIASLGVLQPILVMPVGDRYRVIDGERRLRLARTAGLSEIAAEIAPRADEGWATAAAAAANMVRADMHPVDRWRIMARLQAQGYTLPAASAALGLTERGGRRLDRLSKLHPEVLALLERGDWPEEEDLGVIANAPPDKQAAALRDDRLLVTYGPDKGCVNWYIVVQQLRQTRIPASRAIFDRDAVPTVTWQEDLFAEPGSGEEWFTLDAKEFVAAQKAALATKIKSPPKGIAYATGTMDAYGRIKAPKGTEQEYGADPDKPKRGRTVVFAIEAKGNDVGALARIVCKPVAKKGAAKAAPEPEEQGDDAAEAPEADSRRVAAVMENATEASGGEFAEDAAEAPAPPPAELPAGITKAGLAMIAEAKTLALRARLSQPVSAAEVIAGLVLLLTAPNVSVAGIDWSEHREGLRDLRERLVHPAGHIDVCNLGALVDIAADTLRRCLSVAKPDAEKSSHRTDAGEVAEWIGHNLVAGDELPRFDTAEFLETISATILRKIAAEHGHKPAAKAADLRRQLVGHLPDWRPAAAQFGAPGPKPRRDAA